MVVKEEISLLPSSVKSLPRAREGDVSIKRSFHWLLIATLALVFGWLVLLSVRSYQPVMSEELVRSLMRGQEVFQILIEPSPNRIFLFFKSQQPTQNTQARDRRQSVRSQTSTIEGDIIVRDQTPGNQAGLSASLANPDRLWPGGVVQKRFFFSICLFSRCGGIPLLSHLPS